MSKPIKKQCLKQDIQIQSIDGVLFSPVFPEVLFEISQKIKSKGGDSYLVGGWVRDALLGLESRDFDIEVYRLSQEELIEILSQYARPNLVGRAFGVIHLMYKTYALDFSFPRTENKIGKGHRGFLVQTHSDLSFEKAAYRRDFTINAMGMRLPDLSLEDPYDGKSDLKKKVLRHVGASFAEDSLRVLRGVQFASRFSLSLDIQTAALCRSLSIEDLSFERIFEEFKKWFLKPGKASYGLDAFLQMDLQRFFPEIQATHYSWSLLGEFLDHLQENSLDLIDHNRCVLFFTALLDQTQKLQDLQSFLAKITNEVKLIRDIEILWKGKDLEVEQSFTDSQVRRLSLKLNGLFLAKYYWESHPLYQNEQSQKCLQALYQKAKDLDVFEKPPKALLTGKLLVAEGLKPSPKFGVYIQECFEQQLEGKIKTQKEAIDWLRQVITSI